MGELVCVFSFLLVLPFSRVSFPFCMPVEIAG